MEDAHVPRLVPVLSTVDAVLMGLAKSALDKEGIQHLVRGEPLQDPWSGAYVGGEFEVCVGQHDAARARIVLAGRLPPYRRPERSEAAEYYFRYIDQVQGFNVLDSLTAQRREVLDLLQRLPE